MGAARGPQKRRTASGGWGGGGGAREPGAFITSPQPAIDAGSLHGVARPAELRATRSASVQEPAPAAIPRIPLDFKTPRKRSRHKQITTVGYSSTSYTAAAAKCPRDCAASGALRPPGNFGRG
jgi:hypothetical protein